MRALSWGAVGCMIGAKAFMDARISNIAAWASILVVTVVGIRASCSSTEAPAASTESSALEAEGEDVRREDVRTPIIQGGREDTHHPGPRDPRCSSSPLRKAHAFAACSDATHVEGRT